MNTTIIDRESEPGSWAEALDRGCLAGRVTEHVNDANVKHSCPSPEDNNDHTVVS